MPGNKLEHCRGQGSFLLTLPKHREYCCIVIVLTQNYEILSHYPQVNPALGGVRGKLFLLVAEPTVSEQGLVWAGQYHVFVK